MITIVVILAILEFAMLQVFEHLLAHVSERIAKSRKNIALFLVPQRRVEAMKKKVEELEKRLAEVAEPPAAPIPASTQVLFDKIAELQRSLQQARNTEAQLKAECSEKDRKVEQYKMEAERARLKMEQDEENLRTELEDIVNDLVNQELEKRKRVEEQRDEEAFDKLDDAEDDDIEGNWKLI